MSVFQYAGKSASGQSLKGEVIAESPQEAVSVLRQRHVLVTQIEKKPLEFKISNWGTRLCTPRVKHQDLLSFTQQLAAMMKAGIPLVECLTIQSQQVEAPEFCRILLSVRESLEKGAGFAESLRKHPHVFNELYVNMLDVGEATGRLDTILDRLSLYMEKQATIKNQVLSALAYPLTLLGVACLVWVFMLVWVVPLFDHMFVEFGDSLPWLTQIILDLSHGMKEYLWSVVLCILVLVFGMMRLSHSTLGRKVIDSFLLNVPLISQIVKKSIMVRFTRTLGILLQSGVPILDGLRIAGKVSGNCLIEETLEEVRLRIRDGETIATPLSQRAIFPPLVTQMIRVGESTGALDIMLEQIADIYERELDRTIAVTTSLLEPIVILLIGVGIGVMVIAMYLPLFTMGALLS